VEEVRHIVCLVTNDLRYDQRMKRICTSLVEAGYRVTLVGRVKKDSIDLTREPYDQVRVKCFFHSGPLFYAEINLRFVTVLQRLKPTIVNSVDTDTIMSAGFYRWFQRFTWIHDAHELYTEVPELQNRPVKRAIWSWIEKIFLPKTTSMYSVSSSVADAYKKVAKKPVDTIRNLPIPRSKEVVKPNREQSAQVFLLYQGALNEGRCIDMYIKAMHQLDAKLWIIGEGDLSSELRNLTKEEQLEHKVEFKGWIPPEELRQYAEVAYIGLNVLENKGLSYYYSLSNKSLDYIQAGLPSLNSKYPEYLSLHEEYGVFAFADPTIDSIVEGIKLLLNDRAVYESLEKNCKLAAHYLVWTTEREKLLAIYEKSR